jgi:hypothetical protein
MLRMMMFDHRKRTNDARFQNMMKEFVTSNYNKDISTNDFKLAAEKYILPEMDVDKNGKLDWFFDEWVYGTEMPSYKFTYSIAPDSNGKQTFSCSLEQSGVSKNFVMPVPIYLDFGNGWTYLGSATIVGNSTIEIKDIVVPGMPKRAAVAALQDVLAAKIENTKR